MNDFEANIQRASYGKLEIVSELSISISGGKLLLLLGSNGAGKSTALRAILGTVACASRKVRLDGEDYSGAPTWMLVRKGIAFVPDGARCFPTLSIEENLNGAFFAGSADKSAARLRERFDEVYALFPVLATFRNRQAATFSGGQRQMLAIGRALMISPKVLILDEPSAGLAPKVVEELFVALKGIKQARHCAMLMAEQNVGVSAGLADECIVLEEGHVALQGSIEETIRSEGLRTAYLGI
jgi:branched-chain amino acid transport system ATP-binding protein